MKDNRPFLGLSDPKEPLTALCDNVLASRLADAWRRTGEDTRVGDSIDRGLILLRELNEHGFDVIVRLPTGGHEMNGGAMGGPGSALIARDPPGFSAWARASGDRLAHYYHQGGGLLAYSLCNKTAAVSMLTKSHMRRCWRCESSRHLPTGQGSPND